MANYPLRTAISDTYPNPSNATARVGFGELYDYVTSFPFGQCRLVKSGANLVLQRFNGQWLVIDDKVYSIPAAGVALGATGLTPGSTYYIYAYMSGATMTLEASATVPATDTDTGVRIKTGDATRTLVGMARPITGPAWQDTAAQRFVVSWFNRRDIATASFFTVGRSTASGAFIELNTEIRNEFLAWADTALSFTAGGAISNNTAAAQTATALAIDGAVALEGGSNAANPTGINNQLLPVHAAANLTAIEGYHYVTLVGTVSGGTGTWAGSGAAGARCSIQGLIQG
jgi:hypothetical protein